MVRGAAGWRAAVRHARAALRPPRDSFPPAQWICPWMHGARSRPAPPTAPRRTAPSRSRHAPTQPCDCAQAVPSLRRRFRGGRRWIVPRPFNPQRQADAPRNALPVLRTGRIGAADINDLDHSTGRVKAPGWFRIQAAFNSARRRPVVRTPAPLLQVLTLTHLRRAALLACTALCIALARRDRTAPPDAPLPARRAVLRCRGHAGRPRVAGHGNLARRTAAGRGRHRVCTGPRHHHHRQQKPCAPTAQPAPPPSKNSMRCNYWLIHIHSMQLLIHDTDCPFGHYSRLIPSNAAVL